MANVSKSTDILMNRVMNDLFNYENNTIELDSNVLVINDHNITKIFMQSTEIKDCDVTFKDAAGNKTTRKAIGFDINVMFEIDGKDVVVGIEYTNKCLDWKKIHEVIK